MWSLDKQHQQHQKSKFSEFSLDVLNQELGIEIQKSILTNSPGDPGTGYNLGTRGLRRKKNRVLRRACFLGSNVRDMLECGKQCLSPREISLLKVHLSPVERLALGKATAGRELKNKRMCTFLGDMMTYHIMPNCLHLPFPPQTHKLLKIEDHACSCPPTVPNQMLGPYRSSKNI